jgi:hypothetical protein
MTKQARGFSLIGTLLAVVIVVCLTLFFVYGGHWGKTESQRPDKVGHTIIGQSKARANDAVCMNQLHQLREYVQMQQTSEGKNPDSFAQFQGIPKQMFVCPIGNEPYMYDPKSGTIKCVHPGHEGY